MIRVLLVDDQVLVRAGFRALLDAESDIEVVGEAGDGEAGVRLARKAADESRRKIYVAGSVGPLGVRLAPLGRVNSSDAFAAFKEQIAALNEAGVDALIVETFSDLNEIVQAIKAAGALQAELEII